MQPPLRSRQSAVCEEATPKPSAIIHSAAATLIIPSTYQFCECDLNPLPYLPYCDQQDLQRTDPLAPTPQKTGAEDKKRHVTVYLWLTISCHPAHVHDVGHTPISTGRIEDVPDISIRMLVVRAFIVAVVAMVNTWSSPLHAEQLTAIAHPQNFGPSFDCSKVHTPFAQFICASTDLSKTDLEYVQTYYVLRQHVGPTGWGAIKQEAIDYQNATSQECGVVTSDLPPSRKLPLANCIKTAYQRQTSLWRTRLSGVALEEATRAIDQHVALQRRLQILGLLPTTELIDGVYGAATRAAIEGWQHDNGLPITGFIGNDDANKLTATVVATNNSTSASSVAAKPKLSTRSPLIPMQELVVIYGRGHP